MDIDEAFDLMIAVLSKIILWSQNNGIWFRGVFYSYFNIEIASVVAAIVLTNLPIWRGSFDELSMKDYEDGWGDFDD